MMSDHLFVFDLDFTLWDAGGTWCDHLHPPFRRTNGTVLDSHGSHIQLYPDVPEILHYCHQQNFILALASRTFEPDWARELLELLHIRHLFDYEEIFPASKIQHFQNLQQLTGLQYNNMLFFDDEKRNVDDVRRLGVNTVYVRDGLMWGDFKQGMRLFGDGAG